MKGQKHNTGKCRVNKEKRNRIVMQRKQRVALRKEENGNFERNGRMISAVTFLNR